MGSRGLRTENEERMFQSRGVCNREGLCSSSPGCIFTRCPINHIGIPGCVVEKEGNGLAEAGGEAEGAGAENIA